MRRWRVISLLLFTTFPLFAEQSDLDSVFDAPPEDVTTTAAAAKAIDNSTVFEKPGIDYHGNLTARGMWGLGWTGRIDDADPQDKLNLIMGANATLSETVNAKITPDLGFFGNLSIVATPRHSEDPDEWFSLKSDAFYLDYGIMKTLYIRTGIQSLSWGNARIFTPGNLMDGSKYGPSIKVTAPSFLSGLTLIGLAQQTYFEDWTKPKAKEFAYAGQLESVLGPFHAAFAMRWRGEGTEESPAEGLRTVGAFKASALGTDVFFDATYKTLDHQTSYKNVFGFFREWGRIKLYGETLYDGAESGPDALSFGLAAAYRNAFGKDFDLGIKWIQMYKGSSGAVLLGSEIRLNKKFSLNVAIPYIYGTPGYYDILGDDDFSLSNRLSIITLGKISLDF